MANQPFAIVPGKILPERTKRVLAQFSINGQSVRMVAYVGDDGWYPAFPNNWTHLFVSLLEDDEFPLPLADWWMEIPE